MLSVFYALVGADRAGEEEVQRDGRQDGGGAQEKEGGQKFKYSQPTIVPQNRRLTFRMPASREK